MTVTGGYERAYKDSIERVRSEVIEDFSRQMASAGQLMRIVLRIKVRLEMRRRMRNIAPPDALYYASPPRRPPTKS
jgi:hypothetical protein